MYFKRLITNIFSVLLAVLIFAGCGEKKSGYLDSEIFESKETGLIFYVSDEYQKKGIEFEPSNENEQGYDIIGLYYYYKPVTDKLLDEITALSPDERTEEVLEKFYEQMYTHSKCLLNFTLVKEDEYNEAVKNGKTPDDFSYWENTEKFGTNNGYVYLLSIPDNDTEGMSKEEKAQYEECYTYMQTVKENIEFTEMDKKSELPKQIPEFTAKDLKGNTITNDIFSKKDLTIINIWGTFCTPCIEEMPELGEWAKSMPDNIQIVGLISDITGDEDTKHQELAVSIVEKANADFTQIIANKDFESIMKWVTGVPTTLFVDKNGNILGEPIIGADVEGYKKFVEAYLNE